MQDNRFSINHSLNVNGKLIDLNSPKVMGILNLTPDSFYAESRVPEGTLLGKAGQMLLDGAAFLDLGAYSSRPGAEHISESEELERLLPAVKSIAKKFPEALISVDTFRSAVAMKAIDAGAHIINDISGGLADEEMLATVGKLKVPYICMHMQGSPQNMQENPSYENVVKDVYRFFSERIAKAKEAGIIDLILDPGFGFGKTLDHNYDLFKHLHLFHKLGNPLLIGVSRKSMVNKVLGTRPENALNGSTVLHTLALQQGVQILRVHDVKEAVEAVKITEHLKSV